jgi:endonuclease III
VTGLRTIRLARPLDVRRTLGPVRRGPGDPSMRMDGRVVWRATRTPAGPVTTCITGPEDGHLRMQAWGPGTEWALDAFPSLVGEGDDERGFEPRDPVVADLRRRVRGLRLCRTGAVFEALVPSIVEQKVVGTEARRSYARLVRTLGKAAPAAAGAPPGLLVPPSPAVLARTPAYVFHRLGIERKRADAIRVAASYAHRLEETVALPLGAAYQRMQALPGIGPWTAAEVAGVALGDPDAVSVGDYHLPHIVAWTLAGEPRADDDRMLDLLEPHRGHRGRVIRLVLAGGSAPPRFGPRLPLQQIAAL